MRDSPFRGGYRRAATRRRVAPAWISLRPWYRDRGLRAQVSAPAALSPVTAEELA